MLFFRKTSYSLDASSRGEEEETKIPKVNTTEKLSNIIAFRLCKAGYGTVDQILEMDVDRVLRILDYENFIPKYEARIMELNQQ